MNSNSVKLEICDFLGFCDMNGVDALDSDQVEKLENYIFQCNTAMNGDGVPLVVDAIYDRLVEILKQVNPSSDILGKLWSDDEVPQEDMSKDIYRLLKEEPMRSICTCKSYDCQELQDFIKRLPDNVVFDAHASCKENGHGIRLVYSYGLLEDATSRARNSAGHNLTSQMNIVLGKTETENIDQLSELDMIEIRGEIVLPFSNMKRAREFNPDIVSPFSGVSSMLRDSASREETELLDFVAYKFIGDDFNFQTKEEEYAFLEDLGFTTPLSWVIPNLSKDTLLDELPQIIQDCEDQVKPNEDGSGGYEYFTDGIVFEINDRDLFNSLGSDGKKYNYGNIALKVGYWKQDLYSGFVQTILWTDGKQKYSPVAIIAEDVNIVEFEDCEDRDYITSIKEISNWKELGVVTAGGNRVRRVPLYEPNNMVILDAYKDNIIFFRYGGEAGVVPCFADGTPLAEGKIKQLLEDSQYDDDYDCYDFGCDS